MNMYDHIGLKVSELDASIRFYTATLAPLGYVLCSRDETGAGFGPKDAPALWLYRQPGVKSGGGHIPFGAPDHDAIRKFHAAGLAAGGRENCAADPPADSAPMSFTAGLSSPR